MKKFFNHKFNLVISIGEDCACTSYLRRCNLQNCSYPFDWLTKANFMTRIDLIVNDFQRFLEMEDLVSIEKKRDTYNGRRFDLYENTYNKFHFYHDFPIGVPLEKSFDDINKKYQRRIKRLYDKIETSESILFVWLSHSKLHNNEEIISGYQKLKDKFITKDIYMLIVENNPEKSQETLENDHILIVHHDTISDDKKHHYDPTMGNKTNNLKVFKKIRLNVTFQESMKRVLYKLCTFFAALIPNRVLRQNAKANINMYFYHAKL